MTFQWDPRKADSNLRKHGIGFEVAMTVFRDPLAVIFPDEAHSEFEDREVIVGHSEHGRLLIVCFVERAGGRVRIISARRATTRELLDYEEGTSNS